MTKEHAYKLRELLHKASASLTDEDALDGIELFPLWAVGVTYDFDVRVRFNEKLYKCVQSHTSQQDWTPSITSALWTEVAKPGEIPVWRQPTGAQDAYMIGDKVHYPTKDNPVYICTMDYNIYAPGVYGWRLEE